MENLVYILLMRARSKTVIVIIAVIVLSVGALRFVDDDPGFDLRIAANAGDTKRLRTLLAKYPEVINSQHEQPIVAGQFLISTVTPQLTANTFLVDSDSGVC
jgi:hypothetical protein